MHDETPTVLRAKRSLLRAQIQREQAILHYLRKLDELAEEGSFNAADEGQPFGLSTYALAGALNASIRAMNTRVDSIDEALLRGLRTLPEPNPLVRI